MAPQKGCFVSIYSKAVDLELVHCAGLSVNNGVQMQDREAGEKLEV